MKAGYGDPAFEWSNARRPVEFSHMLSPKAAAQLTDELVTDYEARLDALMSDLEPTLYALDRTDLLQQYARRQGVEGARLLKTTGQANKANKRLVDALIYETASLILSRMLTIRFCEDHELFRVRYISNGGIEIFWRFADHFSLPMQVLLRQSYTHAGHVFRIDLEVASQLVLERGRNASAQACAAHALFAHGEKLGAQPVAQQHRCLSSPDKRAGTATGTPSMTGPD